MFPRVAADVVQGQHALEGCSTSGVGGIRIVGHGNGLGVVRRQVVAGRSLRKSEGRGRYSLAVEGISHGRGIGLCRVTVTLVRGVSPLRCLLCILHETQLCRTAAADPEGL